MHEAKLPQAVRCQHIRQAVVDALTTRAAQAMPLWLCYDPVLNDTLQLKDKDIKVRHLELPAHLEVPSEHRPGFILLEQDLDDDLFETSITVAEQETYGDGLNLESGRSICAWLRATPQTISRLQSLSSLSKAGEGMRWLRWHDPRVFQQLLPILEGEQLACFTQDCSAWAFIDLDGDVQNMVSASSGAVSASNVAPMESFSLRTPQWQLLAHNGLALGIASQWREASPVTQAVSAASILPRIHSLLVQASGYGFAQTDDLGAYTMHHLQGGNLQSILSHDALQRALQDPGSLSFHLKALQVSR